MPRSRLSQILIGSFTWQRWLISPLLIYVCVATYLFLAADRLIFQPPAPSYQDGPDILKLSVSDTEKISALYWPHPQATYTLLYIHGNAEDLGNIRPQLTQLHQQGLNLLAYDYRGYGTSDGQPSEQNAYQEVEAAYAYLTQQLKIPAQQILVQGRSLGGGSAVYLASRRIVGGLILESTFTSIAQVLSPIPLFPFDKFPNLERLRQVRCPVLIIHGDQDAIIPISHGQRLYDAAPGPKQFFKVKDAGHNNLSDVAAAQYPLVFAEFMGLVERYHHPSAGLETR